MKKHDGKDKGKRGGITREGGEFITYGSSMSWTNAESIVDACNASLWEGQGNGIKGPGQKIQSQARPKFWPGLGF